MSYSVARDQVFSYTRGHAGARHGCGTLRSLGIGGHICHEDGEASADPYRTGLLREIEEEVFLETTYIERAAWLD